MIGPLIAALVLAASRVWAQPPVHLEGTVLNSVSRSGIAGVAVEMREANQQEPGYRVTTDSSGRFLLRNLAPGEYVISFEKEGFAASEAYGKRTIVASSGGPLIVAAELIPLGKIGGRVVDHDRQPMGRITVEILHPNGRGERRSTFTDASGRFQFDGLKPGTYFIRANLNRHDLGARLQFSKVAASPHSDGRTLVRAPVYFPGVQKREMAMPIVIRGGEEFTGFEIHIRATAFFRIRGAVLDDSGEPVQKAMVKLKSADCTDYFGLFPPEAEVVSGNDGTFDFPGVGQGEWRLIAEVSEGMGISALTVRDLDLEDVQVVMSPSFTLGVFFDWQSEKGKRPEKAPQLMLTAAGLEHYSDGLDIEKQRITHLYPGRYRFAASSRPGFYLDSVMLGDREITGREIDIRAASPPVRLIYKSDGGQVRGTVEKCAGASVVLLPQDTDLIDQTTSARCDDHGNFEVRDLRPGSYHAIALRYLDWDALREPIFLQSLTPYSVSVRINRNETVSVELRVAPLR